MTTETTDVIGGDSRIRRSRSKSHRASRGDESSRNLDGSIMTPEQRRMELRKSNVQDILPPVPEIDGYHLCWLSTTNQYDPIYKRQRNGYSPVMAQEAPGFDMFTMKGGSFDGAICCNEMVLFKIPMERYIDLMTVFHHDMPLEQEESLRQSLVKGEEDSNGKPLEELEGFDALIKRRKQPMFN